MEKDNSDDEVVIEKMFKLAADRRRRMGCILEHFITLEFYLSEVLEEYFIGNRYEQKIQFRNFVVDKLSFEAKRQLFTKLKFEEIKKMNFNKSIYNDLNYFQRVRNVLSHNLKKFDKEKELFYVEYKTNKGIEIIYLDDKFVKKIEKLSNKIIGRLMKIKMVLDKKRFVD